MTLDVQNPDELASVMAVLDVSLQGVTAGLHTVDILLNDHPAGQVVFEGQTKGSATLQVPHSDLQPGENIVQLAALGGEEDLSLLDSVGLSYQHAYAADQDALRFTAKGREQVVIGGFSTPGVRVVDITNPSRVKEVSRQVQALAGAYSVTINLPSTGTKPRTLLAFAPGRAGSPAAIAANEPSTLKAGASAADMVIVSTAGMLGSLQPLQQFRRSQGRSVTLVDVEDIYDEFNYRGEVPPGAPGLFTVGFRALGSAAAVRAAGGRCEPGPPRLPGLRSVGPRADESRRDREQRDRLRRPVRGFQRGRLARDGGRPPPGRD